MLCPPPFPAFKGPAAQRAGGIQSCGPLQWMGWVGDRGSRCRRRKLDQEARGLECNLASAPNVLCDLEPVISPLGPGPPFPPPLSPLPPPRETRRLDPVISRAPSCSSGPGLSFYGPNRHEPLPEVASFPVSCMPLSLTGTWGLPFIFLLRLKAARPHFLLNLTSLGSAEQFASTNFTEHRLCARHCAEGFGVQRGTRQRSCPLEELPAE